MICIDRRVYNLILINIEDNKITESGGLLIGYQNKNDFVIIDVVNCKDSNKKTIDSVILNEIMFYEAYDKLRLYREPIDIIGIWHLHNGKYTYSPKGESFSKDDTISHQSLLNSSKESIVSLLFTRTNNDQLILNAYRINSTQALITEFEILDVKIDYTY